MDGIEIVSNSIESAVKKIGHWIVGFMKMLTALHFVQVFEIKKHPDVFYFYFSSKSHLFLFS